MNTDHQAENNFEARSFREFTKTKDYSLKVREKETITGFGELTMLEKKRTETFDYKPTGQRVVTKENSSCVQCPDMEIFTTETETWLGFAGGELTLISSKVNTEINYLNQ